MRLDEHAEASDAGDRRRRDAGEGAGATDRSRVPAGDEVGWRMERLVAWAPGAFAGAGSPAPFTGRAASSSAVVAMRPVVSSLVAAVASALFFAAVFVPLERAFVRRAGRGLGDRSLRLDALFFFGQYALWNGLTFSFLAWAQHALAGRLGGASARFASLPFAVQVVAAVLLGDLTVYFFHRACHRFDVLWRFHAVHHSAERLDWVAAHREHPVDGLLTALASNLPAFLLGFRPQAIAPFLIFRGVWAVLVHANVRIPLGPLKWLLGSPDLHHWHHARAPRTTQNFANVAPFIDVLFGTHHDPGPDADYALGADLPTRSYVGHLVAPLSVGQRRILPASASTPTPADSSSLAR
jgi:sterol desaturase/sphingolipid hydroxylase (fatty acid hydroxylase superfamily)